MAIIFGKNHFVIPGEIRRSVGTWIFQIMLFVTSVCIFLPFSPSMPGEGLDPSWKYGMNQAMDQGLVLGRDIIFTFGPYASIYTNTYHPATDALMVWGSLYLGISFALAAFLNFKEGKWYLQALLLGVLAGMMYSPDARLFYYLLLVGMYSVKLVKKNSEGQKTPIRSCLLLAVLLTPFGLLPLVKGSIAILCLAIATLCFILFAAMKNWRGVALVGFIPPISLVVFWLLSGQPIIALPLYFSSMLPIISGYTEAMAIGGIKSEIIYYIVVSLILLWVIFKEERSDATIRIVALLMFAVAFFLSFKGGFVRHDGHAIISGTVIVLTGLLVASAYGSSRSLSALFVAFFVWLYIDSLYIKTSPQGFLDNVEKTYKKSWYGLNLRFKDKEELVRDYNETIARIHAKSDFPKLQGTTDIYSYDQSYLLASGNIWNPRPIFQSYSVYTPALAEKNREHLIGSNAPDNLIFKVQTIDGRLPQMDDGASWPVILSSYAPDRMMDDYLLLRKKKINQDLSPTVVSKEKYAFGNVVAIPDGKKPVFLKVYIKPSFIGKIANTLFKPSQLWITINLENGSSRNYRMISGMIETGVLLSPLVENTQEFGILFGGAKYLDHKKVKSFSIDTKGERRLWITEYEVEFVALDLPSQPEVLRLYGIERLELIAPTTKILHAEHCDGSIDYFNGESPAPAKFSAKSLLTVNGWLAKSAENGQIPESVKLVLSATDGRHYLLKTRKTLRPDVGSYFKKKELGASGYEATADVSGLHGNYTLGLAYEENGIMKLCPQFNIPTQFNGR